MKSRSVALLAVAAMLASAVVHADPVQFNTDANARQTVQATNPLPVSQNTITGRVLVVGTASCTGTAAVLPTHAFATAWTLAGDSATKVRIFPAGGATTGTTGPYVDSSHAITDLRETNSNKLWCKSDGGTVVLYFVGEN